MAGFKFPLGGGGLEAGLDNSWVELLHEDAVVTDTNSVLASGAWESAFTTAATDSDAESASGDPLRRHWVLDVDPDDYTRIELLVTGLAVPATNNHGIVHFIAASNDPAGADGVMIGTEYSFGQRSTAGLSYASPATNSTQGTITPVDLKGGVEIVEYSGGTALVRPVSTMLDADGAAGNGAIAAAAVQRNSLSFASGIFVVQAIEQPAAAATYTPGRVFVRLVPKDTA